MARGGITFVPNLAFPALFQQSPDAAKAAQLSAELVATAAEPLSPYRTGHLRGGIDTETELEEDGWHGRVVATDFKSAWHEFGTRKMPAHPFLIPGLTSVFPDATISRSGRQR